MSDARQASRVVRVATGVLALLVSSLCPAALVVTAFGENRPPYIFDAARRGLEIDIVREALAYRGHTLRVVHLPNARLKSLQNLTDGRLDAVAGVRHAPVGSFLSAPYIAFYNYAISKAHRQLQISVVEDLRAYSVVAWQNARSDLGPAYRALFSRSTEGGDGRYYEHHDQRKQVEMFWRDRVDVIVVDKYVFQWQSRQLAEAPTDAEAVVYHDIFPRETEFYIVFRDRQLREDFNQGLAWLKAEGRYQALIRAYLP